MSERSDFTYFMTVREFHSTYNENEHSSNPIDINLGTGDLKFTHNTKNKHNHKHHHKIISDGLDNNKEKQTAD